MSCHREVKYLRLQFGLLLLGNGILFFRGKIDAKLWELGSPIYGKCPN